MLNPEGVVCGNTRCSLTGDLNRLWSNPNKTLHPQIFYLKKLMSKYKSILVYCDLHGHCTKAGSFIYGCNKVPNESFCSWTKVRLLPRIIARRTPLLNYNDCRFSVKNDRKGTARVVVWKEFGVTNSFTLESSCCGYMKGNIMIPFEVKDYYTLSETLLKSFLEYYYVVKDLEAEFRITKGWLKPYRLIELTGTPAANLSFKKSRHVNNEQKATFYEDHSISKKAIAIRPRMPLKKSSILLKPSAPKVIIFRKKRYSQNTIMKQRSMCKLTKPIESGRVDNTTELNEYNWRRYFTSEEIENAYNKIEEGIDSSEESGTESNEDETPYHRVIKIIKRNTSTGHIYNNSRNKLNTSMTNIEHNIYSSNRTLMRINSRWLKQVPTVMNKRQRKNWVWKNPNESILSHIAKVRACTNNNLSMNAYSSKLPIRNIQVDTETSKDFLTSKTLYSQKKTIIKDIASAKKVTNKSINDFPFIKRYRDNISINKDLPKTKIHENTVNKGNQLRIAKDSVSSRTGIQFSTFYYKSPECQNKKIVSIEVSTVLASVPKHDESPIFKKLFTPAYEGRVVYKKQEANDKRLAEFLFDSKGIK